MAAPIGLSPLNLLGGGGGALGSFEPSCRHPRPESRIADKNTVINGRVSSVLIDGHNKGETTIFRGMRSGRGLRMQEGRKEGVVNKGEGNLGWGLRSRAGGGGLGGRLPRVRRRKQTW